MALVNLKGVYKVTAKGRAYYYAWRGGPRLPGEPGSREFLDALAAARVKPDDASKLSGLIVAWRKTDAWAKPQAEGGMADTTKKNWRPWLDKIDEGLGKLSIKVFDRPESRQVIKRWRNKWKGTPRHADTGKQVLSALLSYAVEEGKIGTNPCVGIANLYSSNRAEIIWTQADLERFVAVAPVEVAFALRLACLVGIRKSDLLKLRWDHVDDLAIVMKTGKSRGKLEYVVPLYGELRALLNEIRSYQARRRAEADAAGKPIPVHTHILVGERGRPWTPDGFGSVWNDALRLAAGAAEGQSLEDAGWKLHFHDARGTAATKFALAGFEDEDIAEIVGWDKDQVKDIVDRYVRRDARLKAKIEKLSAAETMLALPAPRD